MSAGTFNQKSPVDYWPVAADVVIEPFDLCALSSGVVVPFSDLSDAGNEAGNQAAAAPVFKGRAVGKRVGTEGAVGKIALALDVVEYDCASTTFVKDELVGPVEAASGTALEDQKVAKVTLPANAIGRVVDGGTNLTRVKVQLMSHAEILTTVAQQIA